MASNENPLGPSRVAVKAISDYLDRIHRYPDGTCYYLRNAISEHLGIAPENIMVGNGSNEIIELLMRTYLQTGGSIIMAWPTFVVYGMIAQSVGASTKRVPLTNDYVHDVKAMLDAVNDETKIVFIANPNNPTGTHLFHENILYMLERLPDDVLLVLDEAYIEYASFEGNCADGLEFFNAGHARNLILLRTFSKLYGLAGLRIGYGIADSQIIQHLNKVRQPFNVNALAQVAAVAALKDNDHVEKSLKVNSEGKHFLYKAFQSMNISFIPTSTNFILVDVGFDSKLVFKRLLRRGVIVRAMAGYGLSHHIRVTIDLEKNNKRFIDALRDVLSELSSDETISH